METTMRLPSIVLLVLLALFAWSTPAHAAKSYDNCTGFITALPATITTSGTWCLNVDLFTTITSGSAVTVAASDVILDCNDFLIQGPLGGSNTTTAAGVSTSQQTDVRVRHCRISGFNTGVNLYAPGPVPDSRNVIEDNFFSSNNLDISIQGKDDVVRRNIIGGLTAIGTIEISDNWVAVMNLTPGEGSSVHDNHVGQTPAGVNAVAISLSGDPRTAVHDNQLVGASQGVTGTGVGCSSAGAPMIRVHDNMLGAFTHGIVGCADAGENDITP